MFSATDAGTLLPLRRAVSGWGPDHMRGMAVGGALARAAESHIRDLRGDDLVPGRFTLDIFRPVRMAELSARVSVVRQGRRLCLVDAELIQGNDVMARASAMFVAPSDAAPSSAWPGVPELIPPIPTIDPDSQPNGIERLYGTDGRGWLPPPEVPFDTDRKWVWLFPIPVVDGEEPTGFQAAVSGADIVSVIGNTGPAGLGFINADLSMTLARQPANSSVGLVALARTEASGIAASSAVMFDAAGAFGIVSATSLSAPPINPTPPMTIDFDE